MVSEGTICAIGASTKGNTFLNAIGANSDSIQYITDRNPKKVGRFTPSTNIPIVDEIQLEAEPTEIAIVLPWHFKDSIIQREMNYLKSGGKLQFFFPEIHTVTLESI